MLYNHSIGYMYYVYKLKLSNDGTRVCSDKIRLQDTAVFNYMQLHGMPASFIHLK